MSFDADRLGSYPLPPQDLRTKIHDLQLDSLLQTLDRDQLIVKIPYSRDLTRRSEFAEFRGAWFTTVLRRSMYMIAGSTLHGNRHEDEPGYAIGELISCCELPICATGLHRKSHRMIEWIQCGFSRLRRKDHNSSFFCFPATAASRTHV